MSGVVTRQALAAHVPIEGIRQIIWWLASGASPSGTYAADLVDCRRFAQSWKGYHNRGFSLDFVAGYMGCAEMCAAPRLPHYVLEGVFAGGHINLVSALISELCRPSDDWPSKKDSVGWEDCVLFACASGDAEVARLAISSMAADPDPLGMPEYNCMHLGEPDRAAVWRAHTYTLAISGGFERACEFGLVEVVEMILREHPPKAEQLKKGLERALTGGHTRCPRVAELLMRSRAALRE